MPVRERETAMVRTVREVLRVDVKNGAQFDWLINKHHQEQFGEYFLMIEKLFSDLGGDVLRNRAKRSMRLTSDAFIGGGYKCILEFDEIQHFSTARLATLRSIPENYPLGFDRSEYINLCRDHCVSADSYRESKTTVDFPFRGGRTAQRAYFDLFRDLLPPIFGLNPTVRIHEFETARFCSTHESAVAFVESKFQEMKRSGGR